MTLHIVYCIKFLVIQLKKNILFSKEKGNEDVFSLGKLLLSYHSFYYLVMYMLVTHQLATNLLFIYFILSLRKA